MVLMLMLIAVAIPFINVIVMMCWNFGDDRDMGDMFRHGVNTRSLFNDGVESVDWQFCKYLANN